MAISYTSTCRDIVQEAFNLLRQDYSAPAVSTPAVSIDEVSDTSMEWSKAKLSLKTAANEVYDAFGWGSSYTAENLDAWSAKMRNLLVYCLARELAIPIAGRVEDMKVFAQLFIEKLNMAKVTELETGREAVTDADTKDVLSMILGSFASGEVKTPWSLKSITDRIDALKVNARHDVLLAHEWNFACVSEEADGMAEAYNGELKFVAPYPAKALRLVAVYGGRGKLAEWRIVNKAVIAREHIRSIRYIRDVADLDKWSPIARPLYLMRLKALVARTVMNSAQDAAMQEQLYLQALQSAKLQDARESHVREDVWGGNHYANVMRGDGRRRGGVPYGWRR